MAVSFFKRSVRRHKVRVVSDITYGARRWTLEEESPHSTYWAYICTTADEVVAKEWIVNLKAGGTHMRVEFEGVK